MKPARKAVIIIFTLAIMGGGAMAFAAEDVVSLEQIDILDGLDRDEANVIAREFFHRIVSSCGMLGNPMETEGYFEYAAYLGKNGKLHPYPLTVDKISGRAALQGFFLPTDYALMEQKPPLDEIIGRCEASGEEDILAWEYWLQKERQADIHFYCPVTDYYVLLLDENDYPPEALPLAAHQTFAYCKYGNPATMFAVLTQDRSARTEACAEEQLVRVRAKEAYHQQGLPVDEVSAAEDTVRRFKLVSPYFAVVVYTTVYDVKNYQYWVDRSYELLRTLEREAVDCLCPADCPA
jgi:hypothetical protein